MGVYLAEQTMIFFQSLLLGGAFGLLFDAFRITRVAIPSPGWVVFIEDILFFLICAVSTFFFLMRAIDGQLRFFILFGAVLGMVIYFYSLSILVMGLSGAIIRAVKAVMRWVFRWVLFPIWRLFYNIVVLFMRPARFLGNQFKKTAQRCKYVLKVRRKILYNQLKSAFWGKAAKKRAKKQRKKKPDVNGHVKRKAPKKARA